MVTRFSLRLFFAWFIKNKKYYGPGIGLLIDLLLRRTLVHLKEMQLLPKRRLKRRVKG